MPRIKSQTYDSLTAKPTGVTGGTTHGGSGSHNNQQISMWLPCTSSTNGTETDLFGAVYANRRLADGVTEDAGVSWRAPANLVSLDSIQVSWLFGGTGNCYYKTTLMACADAQLYNQRNNATALGVLTGTFNKRGDGAVLTSADLAAMANVVAGDLVGLAVQRQAGDVLDTVNAVMYVVGFNIIYTVTSP